VVEFGRAGRKAVDLVILMVRSERLHSSKAKEVLVRGRRNFRCTVFSQGSALCFIQSNRERCVFKSASADKLALK